MNNTLTVSSSADANRRHSTGPDRLLRLLPTQARYLIQKMLIVDPLQRYTMKDVVNDEFSLFPLIIVIQSKVKVLRDHSTVLTIIRII